MDIEKIDNQNLENAKTQLWDFFKPHISYLPQSDQEFVELAFELMVEKHAEQRRQDGSFYITHPVGACLNLTKIELEKETLAACLLHDVPEDTFKNPADGIELIKKNFGADVAFLVYGVTKLSVIKYKGEERFAENLRKLFVAISQDIRVIFIKLADRIHNLSTLSSLALDRPDKSKRIALESLEIYAPIAERLGISSFRAEIEDLAFKYAYPEDYKKFVSVSDLEFNRRKKMVEKLIKKTKSILSNTDIQFSEVVGRSKKYYSLYRKINQEKKDIKKIYDLVALRIITSSIADCYSVLSIIHQNFDYMDDRVKDYIKNPKENGYKSIHTTVFDKKLNEVFEFQIRTNKMHQYAEYGIASHWSYKQKSNGEENEINSKDFKWIKELVDLGQNKMPAKDYLKHVKLNVYQDRIFALTPKGDAINLPKGASVIDFAFKIHVYIGEHASLAKVNGQVVKLNTKLKNGDIVEILTDKKQKPSHDWLKWVTSSGAAKHIRRILRNMGKEQK